MGKKTALFCRVNQVSDNLNITHRTADTVIKTYLQLCKEQLYLGHRVTFWGIVSVVPEYEVFDFKTTRAYMCEVVASRCGCTYNTVTTIINDFMMSVRDDVLSGKPATINGICTLHPFVEDGVYKRLHSYISSGLSESMKELGNSVRCHTYPLLKQQLIEKGVSANDG